MRISGPKLLSMAISLQSRVHQLPRIGQLVKQLEAKGILGDKEIHFIELCISEAVVNCIRHAYHDNPDGCIDIRIIVGENQVTTDVSDNGAPLPSNALAKHKQQAIEFDEADVASLPESGRGLAIILNHMDSVTYFSKSGRNTLRMTFNFGGK